MVGKFLPQSIYLVTTMVLARYLTPNDFGKIGVLAIIFTVAETLIDSGLGGSLVKEKEKLTNPDYVESYARSNYMMSKDGEQIFYLPEDENK